MTFTVGSEHKMVNFKDIRIDETFIDGDRSAFFEDEILMRVSPIGGGCDVTFDADLNYEGAAVNLTNGELYSYYADDKVYKVECDKINVKYI